MIRINDRGSNIRSNSYHRGSLMLFMFAMALLFGATAGYSQWLETKITLPDSLGGATGPHCLTTDTSERYVYVGDGSGAVYVVDAEAGTRVAKIPCIYVSAVCTNTRQNKVYAADYGGNRVLVISCATNQVVATIPLGAAGLPLALCYNSSDNKTYVAGDGGDLTVIECSSDSAVRTIHLGESPNGLCYNPASNRVFYAGDDSLLAVVDGANDSVVGAYDGAYYGPFAVSAVANKVYVAGEIPGSAVVFVLDGATGVVLDTMNAYAEVMCLNPHTQKLYTGGKTPCEIMIFDCAADTLIDWFRLTGQSYIYSIACDTTTGKVFASFEWNNRDKLVVIDGVADTIAAKIPGPHQGELLVSSKRGRVYSTDLLALALAVFDTGTDSLLRTITIGGGSTQMCYDTIDDKVYYVSYSNILGEVGAVDAATNQPVGHVQVGPHPQDIIWHAPTNRVYCSGGNITVIDPTADTVTKVLPVNSGLLCSAPRLNKVYAEAVSKVAVIDCRNDSVVKTIPVPIEPMWSMCYVSTACYDKLYVGGYGEVAIIDCIGDTIIRSYPFNWSRLVASPDGKRVYCWRPDALCTFDAAGDTLVAEAPWVAGSASDLLYVPGVNKVYCADPGGGPQCGQGCVLVADGTTDSVIAEIPLRMAWALGYDSANGLVYCSHGRDSAVTFIDSSTDSVVGLLNAGMWATTFATVPAHSRVYVGGEGNSSIAVIRTDPPGVEEAMNDERRVMSWDASVVRGILFLPEAPNHKPQAACLMDATGRKVLELRPGANDVRALAPGVYFIREQPQAVGSKPQAVRKVILTE